VDTSDAAARDAYARGWAERQEWLAGVFRAAGVDGISVATDKECLGALLAFFRAREHRV
jgi:hypothetical protein